MPAPHTFAVFALASAAFLAVPGPSVIYIVSRSLADGRRAGIVSALGIQTGAGAAYLVYLGIRKLLEGEEEAPPDQPVRAGRKRLYWQGVTVNSLNPKTALGCSRRCRPGRARARMS